MKGKDVPSLIIYSWPPINKGSPGGLIAAIIAVAVKAIV